MAFTVNDLEDFIGVLRQHPEWRRRVRDEIIGEDMAESNARFVRIEATLERIAADIERIWAGFAEHDAKIDSLIATTGGLVVKTDALVVKTDALAVSVNRLEGKVGNLEGSDYERKFNAMSRLGEPYRRAERVYLGNVDELLDARDNGVLTLAELDQLSSLDFLFRARRGKGPEAPEVFIAFEVSKTVDANDVRRAAERAALIRRAGLDAEAFAGGQLVTPQAAALAAELGVQLVLDRSSSPSA